MCRQSPEGGEHPPILLLLSQVWAPLEDQGLATGQGTPMPANRLCTEAGPPSLPDRLPRPPTRVPSLSPSTYIDLGGLQVPGAWAQSPRKVRRG